MESFILFFNSFISYLLLYFISIALIVVAVILGIRYRKHKDKKAAAAEDAAQAEDISTG